MYFQVVSGDSYFFGTFVDVLMSGKLEIILIDN
jgi:hypothetical protein